MVKLSQQQIEKELIEITEQLLIESGDVYRKDVKLDASLQRHLGIDSLGRAELFQRIEKKFTVSVPDKLLAEAETLNDIVEFLSTASLQVKTKNNKQQVVDHQVSKQIDMSSAETLTDVLLTYAKTLPDKVHIYFQHEDGSEEIITYGALLQSSLRVANSLRELGLVEGETVAIMQPTNPGFFYTFFGTLLAGGIPVPIYPPFRAHMIEAYAKTESHILQNAEVRILVTFDQAEKLSHLLQAFVPSLKTVTTVDALLKKTPLATMSTLKTDDFAFIQYTSGSTANPKGVLLTHANLLANIRGYGDAINVTPNDVAVSWLPLYHDMGLIGMWLGSLYYGLPLVLLTPFTFLNRPERWLWAIHHHRATLSGAPNFAYDLCVRKIDPANIEGLDLSSWRMAANGAEKVYPSTLELFAEKFAPYGFKREALLPVYGLAESTVALAIPPMNRSFRLDYIDRKHFENERVAIPTKDKNALTFVACGLPMKGHEIRIVDDEGHVLPERHVGNLQFRGPSSMQGYYRNARATEEVLHEGWLASGDLAYLADGEVFITGRRKDLIIKAGRNLYPAEIEEIVGNIDGVRQGCVAAFEVSDSERVTEQLIVVAETREKNKEQRETIKDHIREAIATALDIVPDQIVLVAPRVVPKTSSGKLQRNACKILYMENRLGKWHTPAWLQITKLALKWCAQKTIDIIKLAGKIIYTGYMAIMLAISLMPIYLIVRVASQPIAAKVTRGWAKFLMSVSFCRVKKNNLALLTQNIPVIYASNHSSYVDAIILLAILPANTRFVGKKELFAAPIIRTFMRKLNYLAVDRVNLSKGLEDTKVMEAVLKEGNPILIFPEGTFSYASGLRPFRLGAFKMAAETMTPVCPIALNGTRVILRGEAKLLRPNRVIVTVCEPIKPKGSEWEDVTHLRNEVRADIAKYCGEPSLDYIAAQTVAVKPEKR